MRAPAAAGEELDRLVATAQRALGSDAFVVLAFDGSAVSLVARERLAAEQLRRVRPALNALVPALLSSDDGVLSLPVLVGSSQAGARLLVREGFAAALCALATLDGERLGAIVALRRQPGECENAGLIGVFASQAAMALGQQSRRPASLEERLEGLAALDRLVLSVHDFGELSGAVHDAVAPLLGAASTGIMLWDERRETLQMLAGSFGADAATAAAFQVSAADFRSSSARVFATGRAYFNNDAIADPAVWRDEVTAFRVRRLLSAPLVLAGRPIGVLHLADKPEPFTDEDLQRVEALAPKIAVIVELARTLFRLRRQRRLEELLAGVAVSVASGRRLAELLPPALAELGETCGASLLALVPRAEEPLVWRGGDARPEIERAVFDEALAEPGMRAYVVAPSAPGDAGWAAFHSPVHLGGVRVATFVALRTRAEAFAEHERHTIVRLANLAALARATERYQAQRAELARLHERQRIAEDLHDDVAQLLFAAQLSLDAALERDGVDAGLADRIARARALLIRGDTVIRTVIDRLSAPSSTDLAHRLAATVASIEQEFAQAIHLEIPDEAASATTRLPKPVSDALVRVARAALLHATRHDGPSRVTVALSFDPASEGLLLTVVDDGVGAEPATGEEDRDLSSLRQVMHDHGGHLLIRHGPTGGTRVTASVSL